MVFTCTCCQHEFYQLYVLPGRTAISIQLLLAQHGERCCRNRAGPCCLDIDVSDLLHGLVDSLMEKGFVEFAAAAMLTIIARVALPDGLIVQFLQCI